MSPRFAIALGLVFVGLCLAAACAKPEDPARVELRARMKQPTILSPADLARLMDEVAGSIEGKKVQATRDGVTSELDPTQRDVVLGMLKNREGVYDEGLGTAGGAAARIINAPGLSAHPEYSAARKLFVDVETLLPRRFEFAYEFQGMGDYALELAIER